jgi:hypothetical protein
LSDRCFAIWSAINGPLPLILEANANPANLGRSGFAIGNHGDDRRLAGLPQIPEVIPGTLILGIGCRVALPNLPMGGDQRGNFIAIFLGNDRASRIMSGFEDQITDRFQCLLIDRVDQHFRHGQIAFS